MSDEAVPTDDSTDGTERPRRRGIRLTLWIIGGLVLILGGLGTWVALDALRARDALTELTTAVPALLDDARNHPEAVADRVGTIQATTARAMSATTGPHWTIAGWLPWIGDNTRALQTVTANVDRLAVDGLPGLATAVSSLTPAQLGPRDGRIDTAPLREVHDQVVAGSEAVDQAHAAVAGIDRAPLIPQLAEAVGKLADELAEARELTSSAAAAVTLIPALLGADGARDWLVLAQNNAELRATGGIAGAALLLHADDGELTIAQQRSSGQFGPYQSPVLPLTDAERVLFSADLGLFIQDVNLTPDFPRSAELAVTMWQQETGDSPAIVLSLDPVALAGFLAATGPVTFDDPLGKSITLDADNAASFLMSDIYARYQRPADQDAVFALASQAVLKEVMSSSADPTALIRAVTDSIGRHRLLMWSADERERGLLDQVGTTGALRGDVETRHGTAPAVGVFLNLTTASKTGYYLDSVAELTDEVAQPDGTRSYTLRARLTSLLEPGEAANLPDYVQADNSDGVIQVNVLAYAPTGGLVVAAPADWPGFTTTHDELAVSAQTIAVQPGEAVELSWQITTGPDQPGEPVVRLTPGARDR
ncbi:MAG: DUF4012 domain-containing protein [Actinobacteria bacterium]|nr:DUF4012 domain-containing protein [Actinomycetota bacterium]